MPQMKLRGSEFDNINWDIKVFRPGKVLWKPPSSVIRKPEKAYRKVSVKVPCRLCATILDSTKLCLSGQNQRCEAGSLSFGAKLYSSADVELLDKPLIQIEGDRKLLVEHVAKLLKNITGFTGGFRIKSKGIGYHHTGLGSTASLMDAVALAINTALGKPIDEHWLIKIIAFNYGEESGDGKTLFPGQSTGASGHVALSGGTVIVSSFAELAHRSELPDGCKIIIGVPKAGGKGIASSDVETPILDKLRHYDRFMAATVCYWVLMDFIPAAAGKDIKKMGDIIWDLMLTSCKGVVTIMAQGRARPLDIMKDLREKGAEIVFLSSVGPAIVAITTKHTKTFKSVFENNGYIVIETEPDNMGAEITFDK